MTAKLFRSETLCECAMDRLVQTACDLFGAPIGLASIYDDKGELYRTLQGLDEAEIRGSFHIANAVMETGAGGVLVIQDAMADPHLQNHPLVIGAQALRSYAGATISDRNRRPVGAIGVLDRKARGPLSEAETRILKRLAMMAGDLLDLENAERESTGKRQTLELAEAMAGVGHFRVDAATREVFWSAEIFRIHGFAPGSVDPTVESARAPYFPEDAALVRGLIDAAMQTGDGYDARLRLTRADGEERVARTKAHCEVDSRGNVTALVGVFQDITETILAQSALIDARNLAESHSQAKSDFLANMSHEIRTPLTSVIGFSSFLALSPTLTTKERHYVDRISVGSKALLGVINDVLDYSRLEAGAFEVDRTAFDPRAMVETAIALVEDQSNRSSLSLHVEISPDLPEAFVGDEAHLRQVAVNFLSNAVKFTPDGSITVTLSMAGKRLRFAVADTGIGIAPEAIDRLFDRFTQANTSTTRLYGGSGLGLAISRRLIALMDGEIGADSEVGKGSTFWFEVPLPSVIEKSPPSAPEAKTKGPVRVLVADDSPAIRRLVSTMLEDAGIAADEVSNGAEAVSLARATHYDAILMDVHMPILDGVEACQTIHAMQQGQTKTPIVALTAAVSNEQVLNYLSAGMVGHVGKPIRPAELLHELGLALGWHGRTAPQA